MNTSFIELKRRNLGHLKTSQPWLLWSSLGDMSGTYLFYWRVLRQYIYMAVVDVNDRGPGRHLLMNRCNMAVPVMRSRLPIFLRDILWIFHFWYSFYLHLLFFPFCLCCFPLSLSLSLSSFVFTNEGKSCRHYHQLRMFFFSQSQKLWSIVDFHRQLLMARFGIIHRR